MTEHLIKQQKIWKVRAAGLECVDDLLAVEEPLEIRLVFGKQRSKTNLAVTMRTPGNDEELATGFLLTEGIVTTNDEVVAFEQVDDNAVQLTLHPDVQIADKKLQRNFYTTSSCGVCGKASIDAIKIECNIYDKVKPFSISADIIKSLPDVVRKHQSAFDATGGIHAAALFDMNGKMQLLREDVGRHNAMDKLIGAAMKGDLLPMDRYIVLLSGRASFELLQKATMCGVKVVCAVGAPSSLAVETAEEFGITLVGFLKSDKFNIYTYTERIIN